MTYCKYVSNKAFIRVSYIVFLVGFPLECLFADLCEVLSLSSFVIFTLVLISVVSLRTYLQWRALAEEQH